MGISFIFSILNFFLVVFTLTINLQLIMCFFYRRNGFRVIIKKIANTKRNFKMKSTNFAKLYTKQGENIAEYPIPHNIYPRPQLARDSFICLNGKWDFGFGEKEIYEWEILVPFPPESLLSGINLRIPRENKLFYKRNFKLPEGFLSAKGKLLLHIDAADQMAQIYVGGKLAGEHEDGYEPITIDITNLIKEENELKIITMDRLNNKILPYGKQCEKRGGMWYTPFSGIWQTVWLECVPDEYITDISINTDLNSAYISVFTNKGQRSGVAYFEGEEIPFSDGSVTMTPKDPILWSPENPHLYKFKIKIGEDEISSYFALRSIDKKIVDGIPRLCLNGKPYFFHGVLDQGYFSDGISTPAHPELFKKDILSMKELGFNTLRKHIKTEPDIFYYYCDLYGMVVFQDMINNGSYSFIRDTALPTIGLKRLPDSIMHRNKKSRSAFLKSSQSIIKRVKNHPSVLYFTIFNEGWGQFDGNKVYRKIKKLAPNHIIDTASGWFICRESDVISPHVYFKPFKMKAGRKPTVLSEFGGYSYSAEGHIFNKDKTYGYKIFKSASRLEAGILELYEKEIIPAVKKGLCGAILTQLSDVEDETNGLVTYDRRLTKVSKEKMQAVAKKLYEAIE